MCQKIKTLAKNRQGQLSYCSSCNIYKLVFNNLQFELNPAQLRKLKNYVNNIEIEFWEMKYECVAMKRKIPIPSAQTHLTMMFNKHEIYLLRSLLHQKTIKPMELLSITDIDYTLFLN